MMSNGMPLFNQKSLNPSTLSKGLTKIIDNKMEDNDYDDDEEIKDLNN